MRATAISMCIAIILAIMSNAPVLANISSLNYHLAHNTTRLSNSFNHAIQHSNLQLYSNKSTRIAVVLEAALQDDYETVLANNNSYFNTEKIIKNSVTEVLKREAELPLHVASQIKFNTASHNEPHLHDYAQSLSKDASEFFDNFISQGQKKPSNRSDTSNITDTEAGEGIKPNEPEKSYTTALSDIFIIGQTIDWFTKSHEAYHQEIVPRLQHGGGLALPPLNERHARKSVLSGPTITLPADNQITRRTQDWLNQSANDYDNEILSRLSGTRAPNIVPGSEPQQPVEVAKNDNSGVSLGAEQTAQTQTEKKPRDIEVAEDERRQIAEEQRQREEQQRRQAAEEKRQREEQQRRQAVEEKRQREEQQRQQAAEEQRQREEQQRRQAAEEKRQREERKRAEASDLELQKRLLSEKAETQLQKSDKKQKSTAAPSVTKGYPNNQDPNNNKLSNGAPSENSTNIWQRSQRLAQKFFKNNESKPSAPSESQSQDAKQLPPAPVKNKRHRIAKNELESGAEGKNLKKLHARRPPIPTESPQRTAHASKAVKQNWNKPRKQLRKSNVRRLGAKSYRRRLREMKKLCGNILSSSKIKPPGTYVVRPGDNLWRIARRHYRRGYKFRQIYLANKSKIRDPNLIYPCQRFYLPSRRAIGAK